MSVDVVSPEELAAEESTPGVSRRIVFQTDNAEVVHARVAGGTTTDWHYHGDRHVYGYHIDAFVAPGNNPTREETVAFQKFVGTKTAQIEFNNLKGSVPLRTDIDPDELGPFIGLTYEDLTSSDRYPPTIAHGLAVTPEQMGACKTAMSENMMGPYDVEAAADALLDAVSG